MADMPATSEPSIIQHSIPHVPHAPQEEHVASSSSKQQSLFLRLAKMPSGDEPISAAFLSTVLGCDGQRQITGLRVDQGSVIEGRHSTTFRLLLDHEDGKGGMGIAAASVTDSSGNGARTTTTTVVECDESVAYPSTRRTRSVFVKRMTCKELPARSLSKWR